MSDESNGDSSVGPEPPLEDVWDDLVDDARAIAVAYRDAGWEVLSVDVADVAPVADEDRDRFGLHVFVPGEEYEAVETLVERETSSFDAAEVYRRTIGGTVFAVAVERDEGNEVAVVVPLYYSSGEASEVLETALERGELRIHLRPLSIENWVTFEHDEPALFLPDESELSDDPVTESRADEDAT